MIPEQLERFSPKLLKGLLEERDPQWGLLIPGENLLERLESDPEP